MSVSLQTEAAHSTKSGTRDFNAEMYFIHFRMFKVKWQQLYRALDTLKCLSIGTPKIINFPFVSNGKLMFFRGPNIQALCNEAVLCLNFGTPENNEFSIWDKWKIYYF